MHCSPSVGRMHKTDSQISRKQLISSQNKHHLPTTDAASKIFNAFKDNENSSTVSMDKIIKSLEEEGLRLSDPRLKYFLQRKNELPSPDVNEETLERVLGNDIRFIATTLQHFSIIPDFRSFCQCLQKIFNECKDNKDGKVATYIPQLSLVDPNHWGTSVCTVDGQRFSQGDVLDNFTLQSCCKPLSYALALKTLGEDQVHEYIGREPSGRVFNALILGSNDKPHNPMINPGAIAVCSLLLSLSFKGSSIDEILTNLMDLIKDMAGEETVGYSDEVYRSESSCGYRNLAIAYWMMENKCFPPPHTVDEILTLYWKTCSIEVNCESLSVIAATLANGGMCPLTNKVIMKPDVVRNVLSLMQSCGMYDYSGQFAFVIGLPAKSGVSGGVMLVVPSVMGISLWSPALDMYGNSCRCLQFCQLLLYYYGLHPYSNLGNADPDREDPTKRPYRLKEESVLRILFAAARGDLEALRSYFLRNMDMDVADYDSRTALHVAACEGHLDCVRFLVETCKVDIHAVDRHGITPRRDAKTFGQQNVAKYLKCIGASM